MTTRAHRHRHSTFFSLLSAHRLKAMFASVVAVVDELVVVVVVVVTPHAASSVPDDRASMHATNPSSRSAVAAASPVV